MNFIRRGNSVNRESYNWRHSGEKGVMMWDGSGKRHRDVKWLMSSFMKASRRCDWSTEDKINPLSFPSQHRDAMIAVSTAKYFRRAVQIGGKIILSLVNPWWIGDKKCKKRESRSELRERAVSLTAWMNKLELVVLIQLKDLVVHHYVIGKQALTSRVDKTNAVCLCGKV